MTDFKTYLGHDGWHISNGMIDYGPYSSQDAATDSATTLSKQLAEQYALRRAAEPQQRKAG